MESDGPAMAPVVHVDMPEKVTRADAGPGVTFTGAVTLDEREAEKDREWAFDAGYSWNGRELLPFSIGREALFSQLRTAVGAPPIHAAVRDFDAFLADALRLIFICSMTPEQLRPLRRDAVVFQEAVESWADANVKPSQRAEAVALGINIYADAHATEHEPAPSEHRDGESSGN